MTPPVPLVPQGSELFKALREVVLQAVTDSDCCAICWNDISRHVSGCAIPLAMRALDSYLQESPLQSLVPDPEEDTKVHHSRALFDALERSPHARREPLTMTMPPNKWEYRIRAYLPPNQGGGLAIETVHVGTASRDMEIAAFKARMARGEISCIEVVAHVEPFGTERIYSTDPH